MAMPKHRIVASCEGVGDKDRNFTQRVSDKKPALRSGETTGMVYFLVLYCAPISLRGLVYK